MINKEVAPGIFELISLTQETKTKVDAMGHTLQRLEQSVEPVTLHGYRLDQIEGKFKQINALLWTLLGAVLLFLAAQAYETWFKVRTMPPPAAPAPVQHPITPLSRESRP